MASFNSCFVWICWINAPLGLNSCATISPESDNGKDLKSFDSLTLKVLAPPLYKFFSKMTCNEGKMFLEE